MKAFGTVDDAFSLAKSFVGKPFLELEAGAPSSSAAPSDAELEAAERAFAEAFAKARESIRAPEVRAGLTGLLLAGALNGTRWNPKHLSGHASSVFGWFDGPPELPAPEKLPLFCSRSFEVTEAKRKKGHSVPAHPAFDAIDAVTDPAARLEALLSASTPAVVARLRREMIDRVRAAVAAQKKSENLRSYNDLLLDLHQALFGEGGDARRGLTGRGARLADAVRERYRAILIDEFQDTDPVQFEIFSGIFHDPERDTLILVGDPKQSIYGFRGADLHAYNRAKSGKEQFRLGRNYRSVLGFVRAVNALFEGAPRPFVLDWIPYEPVDANRADSEGLSGAGAGGPQPFVFWQLADGRSRSKETVADDVLDAVAGEIVRLLEAGKDREALLGGEPILPKDIAVLVRSNHEAREVRDALVDRGVPCVLYTNGSVFDTAEAAELHVLLAGIANPSDERKVRGALASTVFGLDGGELDRLAGSETEWAERLQRFVRYREIWERKGFGALARTIFSAGKVRPRLLSEPGGERVLTNLLHLCELIQDAARESGGIERTLGWYESRLSEAAEGDAMAAEEHQLRLETDASAVKVVTIHRSKGLQYPVVFLPFPWKVRGQKKRDEAAGKEGISYHDPDDPRRVVCRIGDADEAALEKAAEEEVSEEARLLYVALTRAMARCYMAWGSVNDSEFTGAAWVLHSGDFPGARLPMKGFRDWFALRTDAEVLARLALLADAAATEGGESPIRVEPLPAIARLDFRPGPSGDAARLEARAFPPSRKIVQAFGVTSFTGLSRDAANPEVPERDQGMGGLPEDAGGATPTGDPGIFHLPGGTKTGIFFHELLEELDFAATQEEILSDVRRRLPLHGIDPVWAEPVASRVHAMLRLVLPGGEPAFRLAGIARADRLSELPFAFPVRRFAGGNGLPDSFDGVSFDRETGLLKGAIDLVFRAGGRFYLLDWKSNNLGHRLEDYRADALKETMAGERYTLQADLYAVALHRYLRGRIGGYDYGAHFGGIYYLFIRGIDPAGSTDAGVWFSRPDAARIERISAAISREHPK
jgi:exodeoxyribonuclease V beta subunit